MSFYCSSCLLYDSNEPFAKVSMLQLRAGADHVPIPAEVYDFTGFNCGCHSRLARGIKTEEWNLWYAPRVQGLEFYQHSKYPA
jgi:hypothetical protein